MDDFDFQPDFGMSVPYVLTRKFVWDGGSEKRNPMYNIFVDSNWRLMLFHVGCKTLYLAFAYLVSRRSYIIYVIDADVNKTSDKYVAKIWIEEVFKDNPERRDYYLQVTPIEEILDLDSFLPNTNYLVIPYDTMKQFFSITLNDEDPNFPAENGKLRMLEL